MPKCTITINGQEVKVPEGSTVIEAFKSLDQDIAHYCWHPGLSIAGVCRLCMIEVEGQGKLQIACNTQVQEGMKVSNQSEKVEEAARWGLDFHLINHPLDCPICDQAGECGLQEQYMKYGNYDSSMSQAKVQKKKVVDLGSKIVLDSERCILCSRCVRFTDEVTKTHELGIFNRGDRSEIGTFEGKALENDYALNTVDICPVGALTSKDFRFRQRVWYLKNVVTTCQGCSTGCKVKIFYNKEGLFRVKPVEDPEVNGYWMCDYGRDVYKFVNLKTRIQTSFSLQNGMGVPLPGGQLQASLAKALGSDKKIALVLTGQNTNEDYQALSQWFETKTQSSAFYWQNNKESFDDFDGHLIRGDKNPNTAGLKKNFTNLKDLESLFNKEEPWDVIFCVAPENTAFYPDYQKVVDELASLQVPLVFFGSQTHENLFHLPEGSIVLPAKTFFEKKGSFTNHQGLQREVNPGRVIVSEAMDVKDVLKLSQGERMLTKPSVFSFRKRNEMTSLKGDL